MQVLANADHSGSHPNKVEQPLFSGSPTLLEVEQQCSESIYALGYDYFNYQGYFPMYEKRQQMCTFPINWYAAEQDNKSAFNNVLATYGQSKTTPNLWNDIEPDSPAHATAMLHLLYQAEAHEIYDGQCFPIHGAGSEWGMLNVAKKDKTEPPSTETKLQLQLMALYLHEAVKQLNTTHIDETFCATPLSPREQECLDWTAAGKTAREAALIIGISESTVSFHVRNAISKLNASNRSHAVAVAMARSLIRVSA